MAVIERILARAGYVKLSRYGHALTPDGRIVSLYPPAMAAYPAPLPYIPTAPLVSAAPAPWTPTPAPVAPRPTPVAPPATVAVATPAASSTVIIADDILPDDGDDGSIADDEWEWQAALARARIAAAEAEAARVAPPVVRAPVARPTVAPAVVRAPAARPIVAPAVVRAPVARPASHVPASRATTPPARPAAQPSAAARPPRVPSAAMMAPRPSAPAPTAIAPRPPVVAPPLPPPPVVATRPAPLPPPPVVSHPSSPSLPVTPLPPAPPRRFARGTEPLTPAFAPQPRREVDAPAALSVGDDTSEITRVTELAVGDSTAVDVVRAAPIIPRSALPRLSARR